VPEDYVQAYAWFNLAAAQGAKKASLSRHVVRKRMTPAQIAEAQKLSKALRAKIPSYTKRSVSEMKQLILMLALLWPVGAIADFAAATEAHKRGDFATAMREIQPLAEQGNVSAQLNLGLMYAKGQGVPKDGAEAVKWYRLAAKQGKANAQFNLGVIYANGYGVPEDDTEAVKWYRLSAKHGNAEAQHNLGVMFANGDSVPEDDAEAVKWYRLSAKQSNANAQYNLGVMYANGDGVPEDDAEAMKWSPQTSMQMSSNLLSLATAAQCRTHS
jgi:TPR repeat protein